MSTTAEVHTLVASSTRGRYALDDPFEGHDITSGEPIAILLNGRWVDGSVEYASNTYAAPYQESSRLTLSGYYFVGLHGGVCGLCTGMKVRLR
jgi:Domain of unknown function (DUF5348)